MIRDAQILEKEEIKKDMDDEEKRLDVIMEVLYVKREAFFKFKFRFIA